MSGEGEESAAPPADIVRDTLREYAERGVFRGFDERRAPETQAGEPGRDEGEPGHGAFASSFRFFWLGPRPFHITLDAAGETLTAEGMLPAIDRHPAVREDLERLIEERMEERRDGTGLPIHRRVDPEKATAALVSGRGETAGDEDGGRAAGEDDGAASAEGEHLDLVLTIRNGHHEYAVRKLLNLINEVWVRLQDRHQRYMWEELQAPME